MALYERWKTCKPIQFHGIEFGILPLPWIEDEEEQLPRVSLKHRSDFGYLELSTSANVQKPHSISIDLISRGSWSGRRWMKFIRELCDEFQIAEIILVDQAHQLIGTHPVSSRFYYWLLYGHTWYSQFGFRPLYDFDDNSFSWDDMQREYEILSRTPIGDLPHHHQPPGIEPSWTIPQAIEHMQEQQLARWIKQWSSLLPTAIRNSTCWSLQTATDWREPAFGPPSAKL